MAEIKKRPGTKYLGDAMVMPDGRTVIAHPDRRPLVLNPETGKLEELIIHGNH